MTLDAISIITSDMPAAISFYTALGLELADGGPDAPHTEFVSGPLRIHLDTEAVVLGMDPEWTRPTGGRKTSLAFDCSTAEAVDATFVQLTGSGDAGGDPVAGVVPEPWDAFWGQRYAVVSDPDCNTIDLFATRPSQNYLMAAQQPGARLLGRHQVVLGGADIRAEVRDRPESMKSRAAGQRRIFAMCLGP
ncbi:VOC family protein [Brevibacterium siliguriense]|nr:VOC family protein [Brevibacterium siliguriense]